MEVGDFRPSGDPERPAANRTVRIVSRDKAASDLELVRGVLIGEEKANAPAERFLRVRARRLEQ
jgi:hypothetical protein